MNIERLWWADSVLFLRLACQNTHPIKRFTRPVPRGLASLQRVHACVCVCALHMKEGERKPNVSVLSLLPHMWSPPWCRITGNDNATERGISFAPPPSVRVAAVGVSRAQVSCLRVHSPAVSLHAHAWMWTSSFECVFVYTRVWFVCVCVCIHVCVKCINRAYCQWCTTVEVAVAVAVSLSSLPVTSN